jgi:hypothetical protein
LFHPLLIVNIIVITCLCNSSSTNALQENKILKGRVMDLNEAVLPGQEVIIKSNTNTWKVTTNEFGEYNINLKPGLYQITVNSSGFFLFNRAAFEINNNVNIINIRLVPTNETLCELTVDSKISTNKKEKEYLPNSPILNNDQFQTLCGSNQTNLDILIRFFGKEEKHSIIEYSNAMLSYNLLSVYADKIIFDKNNFILTAYGNVILENGEEVLRLKSLKADIGSCNPKIIKENS